MKAEDKALARARAYGLLAELLVRGPGSAEPSALAMFGPVPPAPDELAAQFVAAFDLGVPPYASVFLERDGCVGGETTRGIVDAMSADGYAPVTDNVAACHLGVLLAHTARLCRHGEETRAAEFVRARILGWLPAYLAALESVAAPFWIAVVTVALELASEHAATAPNPTPVHVGPMSADIDPLDPDTGLREVAVYLCYPARCGVFITDADCTKIGRRLNIPRGFGTRRDRLETLLRSAAEYGAIIQLCDALMMLVSARLARLDALSEGAACSSFTRPWHERTQRTTRMLEALEAGAQAITSQTDRVAP